MSFIAYCIYYVTCSLLCFTYFMLYCYILHNTYLLHVMYYIFHTICCILHIICYRLCPYLHTTCYILPMYYILYIMCILHRWYLYVLLIIYSWIGHRLQTGLTLAFLLWLFDFKTKTSFGFLSPNYTGYLFWIFSKNLNMSLVGRF